MPILPPSNPTSKKVTWLELFFDLVFALALAMSAKPLEDFVDFSGDSFIHLGEFILLFTFLMMFWYRHMLLVNRFEHSSFAYTVVTLIIAVEIVAFIQFLRIWRLETELGSFLATIGISVCVFSIAILYLISSIGPLGIETSGEKTWARAYAKHMIIESVCYLLALLVSPSIRPFWFIAVFIYFERYPFETYFNPKKQTTMNPALINLPPEKTEHKSDRFAYFSLMVYGLVIVLAATPLFEITEFSTMQDVFNPLLVFGEIFAYIALIWYVQFRMFDVGKPRGNQFTVMLVFIMGLLVASTHFFTVWLMGEPSNAVAALFALFTGLIMSILATAFFNAKTLLGASKDVILNAFRQWSYLLYTAATAFFASIFIPSPIKETIWQIVFAVVLLIALFDKRLTFYYSKSQEASKYKKIFDNQTVTGLTLVVVGIVLFFVFTNIMEMPLVSGWMAGWLIPLMVGFFILLNHWLHTRIKPN